MSSLNALHSNSSEQWLWTRHTVHFRFSSAVSNQVSNTFLSAARSARSARHMTRLMLEKVQVKEQWWKRRESPLCRSIFGQRVGSAGRAQCAHITCNTCTRWRWLCSALLSSTILYSLLNSARRSQPMTLSLNESLREAVQQDMRVWGSAGTCWWRQTVV